MMNSCLFSPSWWVTLGFSLCYNKCSYRTSFVHIYGFLIFLPVYLLDRFMDVDLGVRGQMCSFALDGAIYISQGISWTEAWRQGIGRAFDHYPVPLNTRTQNVFLECSASFRRGCLTVCCWECELFPGVCVSTCVGWDGRGCVCVCMCTVMLSIFIIFPFSSLFTSIRISETQVSAFL